jgi:SAM-dependent methyltransferase
MKFAKIYERCGALLRRRRMKLFESLFAAPCSVVDLGGTDWNWSFVSPPYRIRLVNIDREALRHQAGFSASKLQVQEDALRTPFRDGQFDVAFSNSVIENLVTWERQKTFAAEVRRIAKYYGRASDDAPLGEVCDRAGIVRSCFGGGASWCIWWCGAAQPDSSGSEWHSGLVCRHVGVPGEGM